MQGVLTVSFIDHIHGLGELSDFFNAQRIVKKRTVIDALCGDIKKDYAGGPVRYPGLKEQLENLGADAGKIQG